MPHPSQTQLLSQTPFAVLDVETTGLSPGMDRVLEVSVISLVDGEVKTTFNTLVNPERSVGATHIHGITKADVSDAPLFSDIARELAACLEGRVLVGHNAYFDMRFLAFEFAELGVNLAPPFICTMSLCSMLGLGSRQRLEQACDAMAITIQNSHAAHDDALACALLFQKYLELMEQREIRNGLDLKRLGKRKFLESFLQDPLGPGSTEHLESGKLQKPRVFDAALSW